MARTKKATRKFGYNINIERECTFSEYSQEQFGPWHEEYDNRLSSVATKGNKFPDVVSSHDLKVGESGLVVWVEWDSGDSFGNGSRNGSESVGLFKDLASATQLKRHLLTSKNGYDIRTSDGQHFSNKYAPWQGYFECLSGVHIDPVTIFEEK